MTIFRRLSQTIRHALGIWKSLKTNWIVSLSEKFILVLGGISLILLLWQWKTLPPQVPLWYTKPWGAEQLADPHWLFILPLASLLIYIINIFASIYITADYLVFTQMISLSSLLISFLSCVTLIKILFLVR